MTSDDGVGRWLHDVVLLAGARFAEFVGDDRVEGIELEDGRVVPVDLVVVGIGARPAVAWLEGSGLAIDDGVAVGEDFEVDDHPGVFAVGDVAHRLLPDGTRTPGDGIAVRVTAVAVTPKWKGQGLGTVLLGMVPNFTTNVKFIYGGCAVDAAAFYQRAGYDVLQPGELLPFHLGGSLTGLASSNPHYPCWFIRHLR